MWTLGLCRGILSPLILCLSEKQEDVGVTDSLRPPLSRSVAVDFLLRVHPWPAGRVCSTPHYTQAEGHAIPVSPCCQGRTKRTFVGSALARKDLKLWHLALLFTLHWPEKVTWWHLTSRGHRSDVLSYFWREN